MTDSIAALSPSLPVRDPDAAPAAFDYDTMEPLEHIRIDPIRIRRV
jgi:hypothetical protein